MIGEVLRPGDQVVVNIEKESREWGYDPCPDGTVAEVLGFAEHYVGRVGAHRPPGVYENTSWVKIKFPDPNIAGLHHVRQEWSGRLTMLDQVEYERRLEEWRRNGGKLGGFLLRPLPETEFWEGDVVTSSRHDDVRVVAVIKFEWMGDKRADGSPVSIYACSSAIDAGWHVYCDASELTLVERGPIWKHHHGEPIAFPSLEEEARFYSLIGLTEEVRNPANDLFSWTKEEALQALRTGVGHGITVHNGLFGGSPRTGVIRYLDEDLGHRVAAYTLENFQ